MQLKIPWVYFMHGKDDVYIIYEHWSRFMYNLGFRPPAYVRIDIDSVFRSGRMQETFRVQGIQWQPTAPDSPWQDGVSERSIWTIITCARCVLLESNLSKKFWADVLQTVMSIMNNTPTSTTIYNSTKWPSSDTDIVPCPHNVPCYALVDASPQALHFCTLVAQLLTHISMVPGGLSTNLRHRARNIVS